MKKQVIAVLLSMMMAVGGVGGVSAPARAAEEGETAVEAVVEEEGIESEEPIEENVEADLVDKNTAEDDDSVDDIAGEADLEDEETLVDIQDLPVVDDRGSKDFGNAEQDIYTGDISDDLEDQNDTDTDETDMGEETDKRNEVTQSNAVIDDNEGIDETISTPAKNNLTSGRKENGVFVGELGDDNELDGYVYEWADGCYTPYAANELSNCILENDYKVVYKLENGKITKFARLVSVLNPSIQILATPDTFIYQNGGYNDEKLTLNITLRCKLDRNCPFYESELYGVQDLILTINKIEYTLNSDLLNFGKSGWIIKKTIYEEYDNNISVSFGNDVSIEHDVYIDTDTIPETVNTTVQVSGTIYGDNKKELEAGFATISVGNTDLQKKIMEERMQGSSYNKELQNLKSQLNSYSAITIDPNLSNVFTTAQINEIEKFLTIYFSQIINAAEYKKEGILSGLDEKIKKRIEDRVLGKLGINKNSFLFSKSTSFRVYVKGPSKTGKSVTIEFNGTIDDYISGDDIPFASMVQINHKIINMDAVPPGTPETGIGMASFYNMESFANAMLSFIKVGYSVAWGSNADQVAEMIISKPINELLFNGSFNDAVYDFSVDNVKNGMKRYSIHCPVDVYVYDEDGEMCGSIVDNRITYTSEAIVLSVCEDQKYIYVSRGTFLLKLVGTDSGTLEYTVEEFSNDSLVRNVKIEDIPLNDSRIYSTVITDILLADHDIYSLYDVESDTVYMASVDTYQQDDQTKRYCINSGSCGDNATYRQYTDGALEITGTGTVTEGIYRNKDYRVIDLHILNGITSIGENAFSNKWESQTAVTPVSVSLANSVSSIGKYAFYNCRNLESVAIGSGLESLGDYAFTYCTSLKQISVSPQNSFFTSIDGILYSKDKSIIYKVTDQKQNRIIIPNSVSTISKDAFGDLVNLEEVIFPSSLKKISEEAFNGCTSLNNIELPAGIETISYGVFGSCANLTSITIPEGVTTIEGEAFLGCTKLKSIVIPKSVKEIDGLAIGYSSYDNDDGTSHKTDGFIIYGYAASAALQYAKENGFTFIALDYPQHPYTTKAIILNETKKLEVNAGETDLVAFIPETDGTFIFYSSSNSDTYGYLYDADMNELINDDDNGDGSNFLIKFRMTAGTTYYLGAKFYNEDTSGTIPVMVELESESTDSTSLEAAVINVNPQVYKAKALTPDVTVELNGKTLTKGMDYIVDYNNNVDVGTAFVTVTGIGNYIGTKTKTFMILPGKTTRGDLFNLANNIKVTWEAVPGAKYYKVYRDRVSEPVIVTTGLVGWDNCTEPKLEPGKMYTYKIVACLTGKSDSSGDSTVSYSKSIYRLKTTAFKYVKNTAPGKVTVSYNKSNYGDSYVILYADNADMKNAKSKVIYGADTTAVILGGFKKGKTYWFQIRVRKSISGYNLPFYTTFGAKKSVKITQ